MFSLVLGTTQKKILDLVLEYVPPTEKWLKEYRSNANSVFISIPVNSEMPSGPHEKCKATLTLSDVSIILLVTFVL